MKAANQLTCSGESSITVYGILTRSVLEFVLIRNEQYLSSDHDLPQLNALLKSTSLLKMDKGTERCLTVGEQRTAALPSWK